MLLSPRSPPPSSRRRTNGEHVRRRSSTGVLGPKLRTRDRESFKAKLLLADVLGESSSLQIVEGKFDVIYLGSVLHLSALKT